MLKDLHQLQQVVTNHLFDLLVDGKNLKSEVQYVT